MIVGNYRGSGENGSWMGWARVAERRPGLAWDRPQRVSALPDGIDRYGTGFGGPLDLADGAAYRAWRQAKLAARPRAIDELVVAVEDPRRLTTAEREALLDACARANLVVYATDREVDREAIRALGRQLGLVRLDANPGADGDRITPLHVTGEGRRRGYIPYTDSALSWHTDGYYNSPERRIRAIVMHCVSDAEAGGANAFLDPELAYIRLRDADPEYVAALMRADVMTIPANDFDSASDRPARVGPVFSVDPVTGALHMRYTSRTRSIVWRDDPTTRATLECLASLLEPGAPDVLDCRLAPGQGVVCNNVLHNRTAFTDGPQRRRLVYRARYYERIAGTAWTAPGAGEANHALAQ